MTLYQWLCILGIPAIVGILIGVVNRNMGKLIKAGKSEKTGLQALLRNELYKLYDTCKQRGCVYHHERENFQNMYEQYHGLGANGVMDDVREKFMDLPIE